jgi:4-amino-4-deoxy-L-arabinose transferase-like glycosyltransferase
MVLIYRSRLFFGSTASRIGVTAAFPLLLLAVCGWRFFPPAEYVIGGKDPGVYINEGISLHRTGTIFRRDAAVAAVPADARELFFRWHQREEYYGIRFMGVNVMDPGTGAVMPGFPHLLPASVALGYGVAGLRGATGTVAVWGILGVLAVFFAGARILGRWAAFLACLLLILNVAETWYGRYPNAEVVMQVLLFAGLLAFSYSEEGDGRFFATVAGVACALLMFLRFDAVVALGGFAATCALRWIVDRRAPRLAFVVPAVAGFVLALVYYVGPLKAYFWIYKVNMPSIPVAVAAAVIPLGLVIAAGTQRRWLAPPLKRYLPLGLAAVLAVLAVYALFFREPAGRLADYDAYALRVFRERYVFWPALISAIAGFAVLGRHQFWRHPAFFLLFAVFAVFFFRKIHIVPEHFWLSRRFLPMILPGLCLLAAGLLVGASASGEKHRVGRLLAGTLGVALIAWQFWTASAPVAAHVEYRGAIHAVEQLAARVTDRDLVLFEGRNSNSDVHVLAVPLAYAFGKQVLLVEEARPDRARFEAFLQQALQKYERVLFVASIGTDLLSQRVNGQPLAAGPLLLPEYATAPFDRFPDGPRTKDLGYNLYQLTVGDIERRGFALDVGTMDDLNVLRFHARETNEGRSVRWTGPQSFIAVTGLMGTEREVVLVMHNGGRPEKAPPAEVEVAFNDTVLGKVPVGFGFETYRLALPADLVQRAAATTEPAQIRLRSSTWSPKDYVGGTDDRALGVMIDRVEIH